MSIPVAAGLGQGGDPSRTPGQAGSDSRPPGIHHPSRAPPASTARGSRPPLHPPAHPRPLGAGGGSCASRVAVRGVRGGSGGLGIGFLPPPPPGPEGGMWGEFRERETGSAAVGRLRCAGSGVRQPVSGPDGGPGAGRHRL